jgi:hypothetical protein
MKEAVKLHIVCISSNNDRHPVPKIFTPLYHTSLHFTTFVDTSFFSHLNFTHLHFTTWRNNRDILILRAAYVMENIALYCTANNEYLKLEIKPNDQPTDWPTHPRQTDRHTHQPTNCRFVTVVTKAGLLYRREGTAIRFNFKLGPLRCVYNNIGRITD